MNKLIIALSVACASAYAFGDQKIQTNGWFSASAETGASVVSDGSSWSTTPTVSGNKYVIECEIDSPVTFSSAAATAAGDFTEVSFKLDTAIVPADARDPQLGTKSPSAKIAFAASEDSDVRAYYAWLGGTTGWKKLAGATPSATDGDPYELFVTFDKLKANKVQFKIGGTALYLADGQASETWISYDAPVSTTSVAIDFVGSGNVASFGGNQISIEAEIVNDPELGPIEIPEADAKLLAKDTTLAAALQADASKYGLPEGKYTVGTAYAIGLIKAENDEMKKQADGIVVKAVATAKITDNKLPVQFVGFIPTAQGNNVALTYQLMGETGDGKWEKVGNQATDIEDIKIPADDVTGDKKYRYFKVVTTVGVPAN